MKMRKNGSNAENAIKRYFESLSFDNEVEEENSAVFINQPQEGEQLMITSSDQVMFASEHTNEAPVEKVEKMPKKKILKAERKMNQAKKKVRIQQKVQQYYPIYRKDVFYRGNLARIPVRAIHSKSCPELHLEDIESDSSDEEEDNYCLPVPKLLRFSKHMKRLLRMMFDLSILRIPVFILFVISNFVLYFWYDLPYVFLVDYVVEFGIHDEIHAAYLISIVGIVNTIGQVLYGFVGDRNVNLIALYCVSIILCGFSVLVMPLFKNYIALCIASGMFGLFISANYSLTTVILVQFVGMDKLTNAYGVIMMMQGIANILGPPFAGERYVYSVCNR